MMREQGMNLAIQDAPIGVDRQYRIAFLQAFDWYVA